ncbi:zinc finger X-chromosomal protein-like [Calliopsis andreniformis]|uniref:zinc finger X-chromosomal protein-like n=1 Tax=Calliopsis andreniformis TaxID=337506 RepID=UPI003FCEA73E
MVSFCSVLISVRYIQPRFLTVYCPNDNLSSMQKEKLLKVIVEHEKFPCANCRSVFSRKDNLRYHLKFECGQPPRFNCPYCVYRTKHPSNVRAHVRRIHPGNPVYAVDICKTDVPLSAQCL